MENQLMIAVCDDNQADRAQICGMAGEILHSVGIDHSILEFESGQQLLDAIEGGAQFHILLLDVLLEGMSGLELAAALRKQQNKTEIIFVSVNRELALLGYEVSAARYLAKPLDGDKLKEALLYCCRVCQGNKEILLPTNQGQRIISVSMIWYVEAYERGTRFFLAGETVESRLKFKEAEKLLSELGFAVCHRSYLVNLACVNYIRHYEVELHDGRIVPIGKARYGEIRKKLFDYVAE